MRRSGNFNLDIDKKNTEELKNIISQIGWPQISRVGEKAATGAWLLAQHADHDLKFQKKCLKLLQIEVKRNEADRKLAPYLVDRILVNESKKQVYGTQFYRSKRTGKLIPRPIRDKNKVDKLRTTVGLEPLSKYKYKLEQAADEIERRKTSF